LPGVAYPGFSASVARVWRYRNLFITITITITTAAPQIPKLDMKKITRIHAAVVEVL